MDNKKVKTICITGGHLSPAVAVIEEIRVQHPEWKIVFVGREYTLGKKEIPSEERQRIREFNIPFIPIHAGKVSRFLSWDACKNILLIPFGCVEACGICLRNRIDCIVSFGGYVGLPMVIAGWLFGIPTIIHEQTHQLGLANAIASEFANRILLTFADKKAPADDRVRIVGLPVRRSFVHPQNHLSFALPKGKPILYITGGTTGSVNVNRLMFSIIPSLLETHTVIHQTGEISYEDAISLAKHLPEQVKDSYIPKQSLASDDVSWIMHHMDVIIGRSGANTVMETAIVGKPAVYIPLPWSGKHEQLHNAIWYAALGGVEVRILDEGHVTPEEIRKNIIEILEHKQRRAVHINTLFTTGSAAVVDSIASLLETA